MKLHSLIPAVVLGMAALVQAQPSDVLLTPLPTGVTAVESSVAASENRIESLILKEGYLPDVIAQLELQVKDNPARPNEFLPNLIYAGKADEVMVTGDLTLRRVTPVQALALVVTAAGCTMKPILSPDEAAGQKRMIIGYSIAPQSASGSGAAGANSNRGDAGASSVLSDPFGGPNAPRVRLLNETTMGGGGNPVILTRRVPMNGEAPGYPETTPGDSHRQITRIYALGSILSGSQKESAEKRDRCHELILRASVEAVPDAKSRPELSIHTDSRVLIAKATAAQQEIIGEVIKALKENESQPAAPVKP